MENVDSVTNQRIKTQKKQIEKEKKSRNPNLTLREKGWRGLTWVQPQAPPPVTGRAGAQQRTGSPAQIRAAARGLGLLLHARAQKGHHRQAARRQRAPTQGSTRAGEEAGCGAAASFLGSMAAAVSWREKTERENEPRVCGRRVVAEFCSREKSARPSDRDQQPRERLAFWAGKRPIQAGEGTPRRAKSAARPLAVGPRAHEEVAERAVGRFSSLGRPMILIFHCFSFSRSKYQ